MAGGYGQRLRLRLFIEGVEVPVIAAQVQVTPNAAAVCSIQIPPLPEGTRLFPRSLVHLFFLDFYEVASPFAAPGEAGAERNPSVGDLPDVTNTRYKLLFGGEVVAFQWSKTPANRSLVLQCKDWSNYWDYAYQWNNTDLFGPGMKALFSGGATNLFTDFMEDEGQAILKVIQTPSVQYPNLKGLLGGIVHLLEAIGGSYYASPSGKPAKKGEPRKTFSGQNIFFSIAELRLHITQMITAYENDPTASRLINAGYDALFGRTLGGLGQQVSFRQAINALMGMIFHETYAQCCPCYFPGSGNTPSGQKRLPIRKDPGFQFVASTADDLIRGMEALEIELDITSPKNTKKEVLQRISDMCKLCRVVVVRTEAFPQVAAAHGFYVTASRALNTARGHLRSWGGKGAKSVVSNVKKQFATARTALNKAANTEVTTNLAASVPARLNQQIFRPDVWFSAPPRCNVIFPEHYNQLSYQRAFLQEPTRFLLKTNDEFFGEDELFDKFFFAPKMPTLKSQKRELQALLKNDLLEHELFTGILPVFEKMGELNIFGAKSGAVNGKNPKIGLAQRTTNFLYFKYRFAARQLSLQGKFNPYLACGFPALVVDRPMDAQSLAVRQRLLEKNNGVSTPDIDKLVGTNFLCNLTEVAHSVDQSQGATSINCSYARQSEESIEFLDIRTDQKIQKRAGSDATRVTVVAAVSPPILPALGPNMGPITSVVEVTAAYRAQDLKTGKKIPLYQGPTQSGTNRQKISVPIGLRLPAKAYGADVVNFVGAPDVLVFFRAFRITESVPRYRQEVVDLPAEEYIRPGWYGDIWHPALIGKAYQSFFQTGAITDEQQVSYNDTKSSIGRAYDEAEAVLAEAAKATSADDPRRATPGLLALDKNSSVQAAVAFLVQTYSYVRQQGLDVDEFIRTYTWRPIATMVDMFGTSDLALSPDGRKVVSGVEGFHSRAFGPYEDLFGLVTPEIEGIVGIKKGSAAAQRGDTRKRKQQAVQEYVAALQYARAILG